MLNSEPAFDYPEVRCRANMAHMSQSGPYSSNGSQLKVMKTFSADATPLGSGLQYRGTKLIKKRPPPWDPHRALDMVLL